MMAKNQTIRNFSCSAQTVTWNSSGEYPKKTVTIAAVKYKNERFLRASRLKPTTYAGGVLEWILLSVGWRATEHERYDGKKGSRPPASTR